MTVHEKLYQGACTYCGRSSPLQKADGGLLCEGCFKRRRDDPHVPDQPRPLWRRLLTRLRELLRIEKFDIGRKGDIYLTRYVLLGKRFQGKGGKLFLHCFHRSDGDVLHDHPWPFWSLVLWPGYWEQTPEGKKWHGPFSLLKRPAKWVHRVVVLPGRKTWSLVWTGPKERSWGFHCKQGFLPWRQFAANQDLYGDFHGCGEREVAHEPGADRVETGGGGPDRAP